MILPYHCEASELYGAEGMQYSSTFCSSSTVQFNLNVGLSMGLCVFHVSGLPFL